MEDLKFVEVYFDRNVFLVQSFLEKAGKSLETFRYYKNRSFEVVKNHSYTVILKKGSEFVGYGHLDPEDEKHWLGICISETHIGSGYGRMLMHQLVNRAEQLNIRELHLSVDTENISAKKLYIKFGFTLIREGKTEFYKKIIKE